MTMIMLTVLRSSRLEDGYLVWEVLLTMTIRLIVPDENEQNTVDDENDNDDCQGYSADDDVDDVVAGFQYLSWH